VPSILLVRHAQASYGGADYDVLSERAAYQSRALYAHLPTRGINGGGVVVVSGPRRRHLDTAQQVCPDFSIETHDGWDEYSADDVLAEYGDTNGGVSLEGQTDVSSTEFQKILDRALAKWIADPRGSWPEFKDRTRGALEELIGRVPSGGLGIVFTSAGPIAAVAAAMLGADSTFVPLNRVQVNTGVTKLVIGRAGTSLVSFNDHTHLELMNPLLVTYR
jgi:broad specificity phosphatase PhoE